MSTADTIRDQTIQAIEKSASEGWRVLLFFSKNRGARK